MNIASISACLFALLGLTNNALAESGAWQPIPDTGIITTPGRYYLQQDMKTDRSTGITINSNDVTLDLGGHALRYAGEPKAGTFGITSPGRTGVTVTNGTVGGFWFNMHCTQNEKLRIRGIQFDDIPYIAVNVAQSKDVGVSDNRFDNFRYDLPKDKKSEYVIAINIGAEDAVIANNRFMAKPQVAGKDVSIETVFVLFSANVSKNCVVAQNDMNASETMTRSYGVWVATNTQAVNNSIRNIQRGVCLANDVAALVCFNRFAEKAVPGSVEMIGISSGSKDVVALNNTFDGVSVPTALPSTPPAESVNGG